MLDRLGFTVARLHELNPRLVVLSITGFGHDGPEGGRAGYDQIAQGEAGLMSLTGSGPDDPQRVGVPIADLLAGMYGAYGVLAALLERERTGRGQVVRTLAAGRAWSGSTPSRAPGGPSPARSAARRATTTPRSRPTGCSTAADGAVQIAVGSEGLWRRFCAGFGLDPDAAGHGDQPRAGRATASGVIAAGRGGLRRPGTPPPLLARLAEIGVPAGKVRTLDEVYALGPDPLPGPAHRRRARHPRAGSRCPARRCGSSPTRRTPTRTRTPWPGSAARTPPTRRTAGRSR